MVHLMEACLLTALQAYLLGSLLFGVLVSKLFYHDDVRLHGSGNAGMTNVLRTYGKLPAVITTIGDVGKSVVAVKLGQSVTAFQIIPYLFYPFLLLISTLAFIFIVPEKSKK